MEVVSSGPSEVAIQASLFDSIRGLLGIAPIFLAGVLLLGIMLAVIYRKDREIPRVRTAVLSLTLYYYLYVMLTHVVGIPTLAEFRRVSQFGEPIFNPNINLIPLRDGGSLSFLLNIVLFVPLGFLCPLISKTFERVRNTFLMGLALSLLIEMAQLFTLYRATDIDDLLTNVAGTMVGYICFRLIAALPVIRRRTKGEACDYTAWIPGVLTAVAFVVGFFS